MQILTSPSPRFEEKYLNKAPDIKIIRHYNTLGLEDLWALARDNVRDIELLVEVHRNLAELFYRNNYLGDYDCLAADWKKQEKRRQLVLRYYKQWGVDNPTTLRFDEELA